MASLLRSEGNKPEAIQHHVKLKSISSLLSTFVRETTFDPWPIELVHGHVKSTLNWSIQKPQINYWNILISCSLDNLWFDLGKVDLGYVYLGNVDLGKVNLGSVDLGKDDLAQLCLRALIISS